MRSRRFLCSTSSLWSGILPARMDLMVRSTQSTTTAGAVISTQLKSQGLTSSSMKATIRTWSSSSSSSSSPISNFASNDSKKLLSSSSNDNNNKTTIFKNNTIDCLFISNVYPDPSASAAGVRTQSLIKLCSQLCGGRNNIGYATTTTTKNNDPKGIISPNETKDDDDDDDDKTDDSSIQFVHLPPNRSDSKYVKDFFLTQQNKSINTVIYDRFYMEEAFSFLIYEYLPSDTIQILDMQDMHSLRLGRQQIVQKYENENKIKMKKTKTKKKKQTPTTNSNSDDNDDYDPFGCLDEVLAHVPSVVVLDDDDNNNNDRILRELASIYRSDLTLVCSPYEMDLLTNTYNIPSNKLCLAPFFVPSSSQSQTTTKKLTTSQDTTTTKTTTTNNDTGNNNNNNNKRNVRYIFCGGFKHDPNVDAVHILINHIWPKIQDRLQNDDDVDNTKPKTTVSASLHIHGAYCTQHIYKYHDPSTKSRIYIHGYTPSLQEIFQGQHDNDDSSISISSVLLAPLRFGAGIKGKIIDAWTYGMPVVTTPIGSEGMTIPLSSNNNNSDNDHDDRQQQQVLFGGRIASTIDDFVNSAIELALDSKAADEARDTGRLILQQLYDLQTNESRVVKQIENVKQSLKERRHNDIPRALLWHQSNRSTKYFSKWIELKEERNNNKSK